MSTDSAAIHAGDGARRDDAVARLHEALGAGRRNPTETDERLARAYAARHRHEPAALLADPPTTTPPSSTQAATWAPLWTCHGVVHLGHDGNVSGNPGSGPLR